LSFHVFTTILVDKGQPRFLDDHLARLQAHASYFGFPYPGEDPLRDTVIARATKQSRYSHKLDRYLLRIAIDRRGHVSATTRDLNLPANNTRIIVTDIKVDPRLAAFKTSSNEPYRKARDLALQHDVFEALLIDEDGYVVDGSRSSPLLFCDNAFISLEGGLQGITREKVLLEAASLGIEVRREKRKAHELSGTLLVAGSGIGLVSSSPIDHPLIAKLIDKFLL